VWDYVKRRVIFAEVKSSIDPLSVEQQAIRYILRDVGLIHATLRASRAEELKIQGGGEDIAIPEDIFPTRIGRRDRRFEPLMHPYVAGDDDAWHIIERTLKEQLPRKYGPMFQG
jgi:hypothetical protein